MNCVNHPQTAAVAYCRTCGKALCQSCTRTVHGVVYCEDCLASRVEGQPAAVAAAVRAVPVSGGPNPAIAGILSGFLPFGTGVMYSGEFVRALVHAGGLIGAIIAISTVGDKNDAAGVFFGLFIAFWYFFMIFDSVRVARAKQQGQPVPDLFGMGIGGPATPVAPGAAPVAGMPAAAEPEPGRFPVGAIVLMGIGFLFLLSTMDLLRFEWFDYVAPLFVIGIGLYLFYRQWQRPQCHCVRCMSGCSMWAAVVTTIGVLFLLHSIYMPLAHRIWPIIFIVIGVMLFLRNSGPMEGHIESLPPQPPPPVSDEVSHG
jgi:hypothetical protein